MVTTIVAVFSQQYVHPIYGTSKQTNETGGIFVKLMANKITYLQKHYYLLELTKLAKALVLPTAKLVQ
jgi:hypothetical protein